MKVPITITSIKVNYSAIRKKLAESPVMKGKVKTIATRKANSFFIPRKRELMTRFSTHPVSLEIQGGDRASNISGTLGGYGNLFTFIGFERGSNPVGGLERYLESTIKLQYIDYKQLNWRFKVTIPERTSIIGVSGIPWQQGASWALEIEKGISGLGFYMKKDSNRSRSGGGIQVKSPIRPVIVSRTPYLGDMLETFRKRLLR